MIDHNYEHTPNFRDLTRTSLVLLKQPVVRSIAKLRRLRSGLTVLEGPVSERQIFRRSSLTGSLYH